MPQHLIAVVGPTACGKTALGVSIAAAIKGEVISGDSRQVYRGLDLGTGKVTRAEMQGIPHHLIDVAEPGQQYTAADFVRDGKAAVAAIVARGRTPVLVGGSGFYIDALLGRVPLSGVPKNPAVRERLAGANQDQLVAELRQLDPKRLSTIDTKNPRRLVRAIEIASHGTGSVENKTEWQHPVLWIGLTAPREVLRKRIHDRLIERLDAGMLAEAQGLHNLGLSFARMDELGLEYRYLARHLEGKMGYEEMVEILELEIYKYAKRQMTWFKRNPEIRWFDVSDAAGARTFAVNPLL